MALGSALQNKISLRRAPRRWLPALLAAGAALFASGQLVAQETGPLPAPPPSETPQAPPARAPENAPGRITPQTGSHVDTAAPAIPVEQIIQKFAAREAEFKTERDNYTYTQTFVMQTIDPDGQPDGEYRMTSDIIFTPAGKRIEHVTDAPAPSLQRIILTQQDLDDLEHVQPFVLTTQELPKYDVKYVGRQQVDELTTYVFDVGPKIMEKNQRYFQGRIWVDDKDYGIVKTDGKAVPDIKKHGSENVFPRFETFRENIDGHYWFPTYTRSNDTLHFTAGDIRIHMTVRYANYQRFGSTIKIGTARAADPNSDKPDESKPPR
ncbi:MAG TPA: hypothetical protein VKF79_04280 [Candidatus Acidoferrum sp.]|nr:hypothetical protein [Candidatus Acidoferrum sp.]